MLRDLNERLEEWEERRERGDVVAVDDLCADWPEGRAELARCVRMLEACDRLLAVDDLAVLPLSGLASPARPDIIAGYEVRGELGRGGMGVVYRVWDPVLCREAALKTLHRAGLPILPEDAARLEARFRQEAQVLAQLKHENIVPVYEAKVHEGRPFFVMECVEGGSLAGCMAEMTAAGPKKIVPFVEKVARAVAYAHGKGVMHRDLKPGNILRDKDGKPRVSDFGLAKLVGVEADPDTEAAETSTTSESEGSWLTVPGFQPGTPAYMAPEQFDSSFGAVGPTTDVWALGVILYEMLTGRKPFLGDTREPLRQQVCRSAPNRPRSLHRAIDRRLEAIVLRCLEKDPAKRFASARAFADALERWCKTRQLVKWVVASVAGLVFFTGVLGLVAREMAPERRYERQVQVPLARLDHGEEVELIAPEREIPAHRIRCGEGHTTVRKTDEGVTIVSQSLGIVEFLPPLSVQRYRIIAELRHDQGWTWKAGMGGVGVTFTGRHVPSPAGSQNVVSFLGFDDWIDEFGVGKQETKSRAILQSLWYLDTPTDGKSPFKLHFGYPQNWAAHYDTPAAGVKPIRTVVIDVSPEGATAFLDGMDKPSLGPMAPEFFLDFERQLRDKESALQGVDLSPIDRTVVGILVAGGQCTVHRLRVVPLSHISR